MIQGRAADELAKAFRKTKTRSNRKREPGESSTGPAGIYLYSSKPFPCAGCAKPTREGWHRISVEPTAEIELFVPGYSCEACYRQTASPGEIRSLDAFRRAGH